MLLVLCVILQKINFKFNNAFYSGKYACQEMTEACGL